MRRVPHQLPGTQQWAVDEAAGPRVAVLSRGTESQREAHAVLPRLTTNSSLCLHLQGISQAARYIYRRLINDGILSQAFSIAPVRF